MECLQDWLLNVSSEQGDFLIVEAVSSKFLRQGGYVGGDVGIGESGGQRNVPSLSTLQVLYNRCGTVC